MSRKKIIDDIMGLIYKENRYLTTAEIVSMLNISKHLLSKLNISIYKLNKLAGVKKPTSVFEDLCYKYLSEEYGEVERQKTFDDCLSEKGNLLKFDFYIPSENLLVEAQGTQHWNLDHVYTNEYTIDCDRRKFRYAKRNKLKLATIEYKPLINKQYVLDSVKLLDTKSKKANSDGQSAGKQIDLSNFKPITGFEDLYMISTRGEVYSIKTNKILKHEEASNGYMRVDLRRDNSHKHMSIHRLVAIEFIPNPQNKLYVNHKDCNPKNNNVKNLEWCTHMENIRHSVDLGRKTHVLYKFIHEDGNVINAWGSHDIKRIFPDGSLRVANQLAKSGYYAKWGAFKGFKVEKRNLKLQRLEPKCS